MSNSEKMQGQEHDDEQSSDIEESGDNVGRDEGTDEDDDSNGNMQQEDGDNNGHGVQNGQEQSGDEGPGNGQGSECNNSGQQQQQQQQMDRTSATNLIINYLPQDMTDRELYNLFSGCGPINTCKIMRDFKVSLMRAPLGRHRNRPDIASATASWTTKRSRTRRTPSKS
ncbi:protein elav isoform X3 [Drosophila ficusphila]|uniref:protein elav isoform X3 n=1 Tax=Drosophila ficusphila TaxID=30025 RepID=UPI001C8966EF|nr:protein elav isoform X3 [Drosophila ficusphila]